MPLRAGPRGALRAPQPPAGTRGSASTRVGAGAPGPPPGRGSALMVEVDAELERLKAHTRNARKRLSIRFGRDTPVHCRGKWTFEARQNHGLRAPGLMSFALAAIESGYKGDLPPPPSPSY